MTFDQVVRLVEALAALTAAVAAVISAFKARDAKDAATDARREVMDLSARVDQRFSQVSSNQQIVNINAGSLAQGATQLSGQITLPDPPALLPARPESSPAALPGSERDSETRDRE